MSNNNEDKTVNKVALKLEKGDIGSPPPADKANEDKADIERTILDPIIKKIDNIIGFVGLKKSYAFENESVAAASGPIRIGIWLFLIVFVFIGGWAAFAPLDSAANAPGTVVLGGSSKTVQHLEGGIISEILIHEGDLVKEGQPLIKLDETKAKATWEILSGQLRSAKALEARLLAERDSKEKVTFDEYLMKSQDDLEIAEIMKSQQALFISRRDSLNGQVAILEQRMKQFDDEIKGLTAQKQSADRQLELINEEVVVVEQLVKEGKAVRPRLLSLQREQASLEGRRGEYLSLIARAGQSITENKLAITNLKHDMMKEVMTQLRETQAQVADVEERVWAAEDVLKRSVITASQEGIISGLKFHTVGGVIAPGSEVMNIVPQDDERIIEAQVSPQDIDVVKLGMSVKVFLAAYSTRSVPMLDGEVILISPDRFIDQYTGMPYYKVNVKIPQETLDKVVVGVELRPGMSADVQIITGERTPLQYMIAPLASYFTTAFKEE